MITKARLLEPDEPHPVTLENEAGSSVFFLTCEHAGRAFPRRLGVSDIALLEVKLEARGATLKLRDYPSSRR